MSDWTELIESKAVTVNIYTGTVGTTASDLSVNPYLAVRVVSIDNAGKKLQFSMDDESNYHAVPSGGERFERYDGETLHVKSDLASTNYEVFVLEHK